MIMEQPSVMEQKMAAMEYIRKKGGNALEAADFAKFQVGFPDSYTFDDIYISYIAAIKGPEAISMRSQYTKEFK